MKVRKNYVSFDDKPVLTCPGDGRTKQSFRDECDINNIMRKYNKTGLLPDMIKANPRYGDFSSVLTYQESLQVVFEAQKQFENLPANVRARFGNEPAHFLAFANDPQNVSEMVSMGLAIAKPSESVVGHPDSSGKVSKKGSRSAGTPKASPGPPAGEGPDA